MAFIERLVADSSSHGHHLKVIGVPTITASDFGGFGNKVSFLAGTAAYTDDEVIGLTNQADWTIEAKVSNITAGSNRTFVSVWGDTAIYEHFELRYSSAADRFEFVWRRPDGAPDSLLFGSSIAGSGSRDIAVDFSTDGYMLRAYVDGVVMASKYLPGFRTLHSFASFMLGNLAMSLGSPAINGLDEVRISDVARYAGAYTPDASPFTNDENTLALYHLDELVSIPGGFVETLTTTGAGTWTCPSVATHGFDVTEIDVEGWGGGRQGENGAFLNGGRGGGGAAYSRKYAIPVTPGVTYNYFVGAQSQDSWFVNTSTYLAKGATSANGALASACIGDVRFSGGTAGTQSGAGASGGAGAAGDGENGQNSPNSGVATSPGGPGGELEGGDGGAGASAGIGPGTAGQVPGGGGGGGGGTVTGNGGGGGRGEMRLRYIRRFKTLGEACAVLSAETARDIDRTNAVSSLALDVALHRAVERTGEAVEQLDADLVRKLISRQGAATEGVDTSVQRMTNREGAAAAEFDAETRRSVSRQGKAAEELDCALVRKQIGRTGTAAEGVDAELVRKQIGRTGTAAEALDAEVPRRTVGRVGEATEGVDAEVFTRTIERRGQATELLDAELRRVFEKYGAAIEDLLGDINARTIHRNAEPAIAALAVQIRRSFARAGVATEELDVTYELVKRQADFDTFTQLRSILLQHGHEWLNQHFGPLLLRILQTINIDGESSEDHE